MIQKQRCLSKFKERGGWRNHEGTWFSKSFEGGRGRKNPKRGKKREKSTPRALRNLLDDLGKAMGWTVAIQKSGRKKRMGGWGRGRWILFFLKHKKESEFERKGCRVRWIPWTYFSPMSTNIWAGILEDCRCDFPYGISFMWKFIDEDNPFMWLMNGFSS